MKESISYSFLLNIIILFIFVCAAIISGIFSYYRAFRAGTIIVNEIEKYEGFNCVSQNAIAKKLSGVSYNLPFNVTCKKDENNCVTDVGSNYKVYSYNLDVDLSDNPVMVEKIELGDKEYDGSISKTCSSDGTYCKMSSEYQYGVYTYMYTDLPIVSGFLRIPVYNKTKKMQDQRNLVGDLNLNVKSNEGYYIYDYDIFPSRYTDPDSEFYKNGILLFKFYAQLISQNYTNRDVSYFDDYNDVLEKYGHGVRTDLDYLKYNGKLRELFRLSDASDSNEQSILKTLKKNCGTVTDWSLF